MRRLALAAALAACACAHPPAAMDAPDTLAAAETAFAAHSVREDMRAAFLAAFADDGVFVRDGWTNSNAYLRGQPAPPIVLDWRPAYVEVAASGELGLSTGPWKITSRSDPAAAPAYGQFVSVWRREGGGWKVAADIGIGHPEPALWQSPLEARRTPGVAGEARDSIAQAEERFAREAAARGVRAAYAAFGAADLRYYRNGSAPRASRAAALESLGTAPGASQVVERVETARSEDFGYARGHSVSPGSTVPDGYWLRVWRRESAGWRIVLDVLNPAPRRPAG